TEFSLPTAYMLPGDLTVGPDGDFWFAEGSAPGGGGAIGRITPAGGIAEFPLPAGAVPGSSALTVGPDGDLWFAVQLPSAGPGPGPGAIGRITPAGAITDFPLPTANSLPPGALTAGPDGNLWFAEGPAPGGGGAIGRITPAGGIAE